jgi:hypothetical protein
VGNSQQREDFSMPGMGPLSAGDRYVIMVQIPGPKNQDDAKKLNDLVKKLREEMGAEVKISITGPKPPQR